MRVAVVGCGTAGPAAALNIVRRLGWTVELFEKTREPSAVGAGIGIQPIGMTAASKLGIFGKCLQHGARVDSIKTRSEQGGEATPVLDIAYKNFDERLFGLGLHRGVLFHLLLDACLQEPAKISPRFGVEVTEIEDAAHDKVTLRDADSRPHGPFDLVVLADGTNSHLRSGLGVPHAFKRYDYGALFALLPDDARTFGTSLTQG